MSAISKRPKATTIPPAPMIKRRLKRSTSPPTAGSETAVTNIKAVTAKVRVERLHLNSSDMGLRTNPKANWEPLSKNRTRKPALLRCS